MSQAQNLPTVEFLIRSPHGGQERILVESDRAMIGSAAHCEIRLPSAQAAAEHVLVFCQEGRVHVCAKATHPAALLNGREFTVSPVASGAVLRVGETDITVSFSTDGELLADAGAPAKPLRPGVAVLGAVLGALAFVLFSQSSGAVVERAPIDLPALFPADRPSCPQHASDQALSLAHERKLMAEGKRERSPFDVRDGVAAVPLFQVAGACFRVGGDDEKASEMASAAASIKARLEMSYRAHQARLMYALDIGDVYTAKQEVETLHAMLDERDGPYVEWLANSARRLQMKIEEHEKKRR